MKIYTNNQAIIRPNPNCTGKQPTHHMFVQAKKKDGTEFEIKVASCWRNADGTVGVMMTDNSTNPNTGVEYSGYTIVKRSDVEEKLNFDDIQ